MIGVRGLAQHAEFDDRLGHLLDEQRHAVGSGGDLVEQGVRQALAAGDAGDDRLRRGARQPVQRQPRHDRMAGEGGNEGRARSDQHQDAGALHPVQRQLDQLQGRGVDPVRVLDHPQHRPSRGEAGELVDQGGQRAVAALLRRQRQRAVARLAVDTQKCRDQGRRPRSISSLALASSASSLSSRRSVSSSAAKPAAKLSCWITG